MSNFATQSTTHVPRQVETTEWEDVLVRKGIVEERAEVKAQREARAEAAQRTEVEEDPEERAQKMTLGELAAAEDELEEDLLERIRQARLAELKREAAAARFGTVLPLAKADFIRDVTEASREIWVVVEMFKDGIQESSKCSELLREIARRKPAVKFLRIRSTDCVEGWPDSSVPCLFLYHDGVMQKQLVGLDFCGGAERATANAMEFALAQYGVFRTELKRNPLIVAKERRAVGLDGDEEEEGGSDDGASERESRTGSRPAELPESAKLGRGGAKLASLDADDDDDW
mmetsp:Transcript_895/g.2323  ORF Transcript_895/g.2323 Transcript_895/m.2323 type:complete len:288 (-) Transcript_895:510-1373(-)|eukprot:CAMPEP_0202036516 /NCGR_PEP_ID=MMETSP0962-20130828/1595_1 /ASSEMBLY_ACC=CAM_ASM_000488 /TAXON_ID=4773 /ORGANISM="Schizochytrium aggregatum, Strain ATCC28209" /LENGTH=287 /DNA_ID=CAMNT_0048600595 /DNA_START=99 /DNA_END=962 /DNA_ORIENTATION=-